MALPRRYDMLQASEAGTAAKGSLHTRMPFKAFQDLLSSTGFDYENVTQDIASVWKGIRYE